LLHFRHKGVMGPGRSSDPKVNGGAHAFLRMLVRVLLRRRLRILGVTSACFTQSGVEGCRFRGNGHLEFEEFVPVELLEYLAFMYSKEYTLRLESRPKT
jgi:hypothetical protein